MQEQITIKEAFDFAEYFRNNFDYYDCTDKGNVYKWIDKRDQQAMNMFEIFTYWNEHISGDKPK